MDTATPMANELSPIAAPVRELTQEMVQSAVAAAHRFLDWQRDTMYGQPDAQARAEHRQTLKLLLRLLRVLHAQAADPEFPDRSAAQELEAVIWKLDQSWQQFYNPMSEAEADEMLRECFPGHGP